MKNLIFSICGAFLAFVVFLSVGAMTTGPITTGTVTNVLNGVYIPTSDGVGTNFTGTNVTIFSGNGGLVITNSGSQLVALRAGAGGNNNFGLVEGGTTKWIIQSDGTSDDFNIVNSASANAFSISQAGLLTANGTLMAVTGITNVGWYHGTGILTNLADILTGGDLIVSTAGKGLQIKTGSNAKMGKATLTDGLVTVSTTAVTANSHIFLTRQTTAGTMKGYLTIGTVVAGTSFVIRSTADDNSPIDDDGVVAWMIVEPAP